MRHKQAISFVVERISFTEGEISFMDHASPLSDMF